MPLAIGDTIGDYQIIGVLGRGGMGEVFRVRNTLSDRVEAMKVVLPDLGANPESADRFLREIKLHASLEHPNIAGFRTALRVGNQIVMVMELVEGVSLSEMMAAGPLDWRDAIGYIDQVLSALSFAHGRGVIHRDIKPANILVTFAGQVKLTDFGIAHSTADPRLTASGLALGSLLYMSPEQVKSEPLDVRSDVYSVGVTLYEMVTGRRPIQGASEYALMTAQISQMPAPPSEVNPALPSALSAIIMISLAKNPAERFQTAQAFRVTLRALQTPGAELRPIGESRPAPMRRRSDTLSPTQQPPPPTKVVPTPSFDPALLKAARQKLAPYIGPIAGILVDRAAKKARTTEELYQTLAAEIASEVDRKAFLESLQI